MIRVIFQGLVEVAHGAGIVALVEKDHGQVVEQVGVVVLVRKGRLVDFLRLFGSVQLQQDVTPIYVGLGEML